MSEPQNTRQRLEDDLKRLQRGGHLTAELVAAYHRDALSRSEGEHLIVHLARCTDCIEIVVEAISKAPTMRP